MLANIISLLFTLIALAELSSAAKIGLFCADDGTYSGEGELALIKNQSTVTRTVEVPLCLSVVEATFVTKGGVTLELLFVTTGINMVNAAACTTSALAAYKFSIILWAGTSGWSPIVGGMNPLVAGGCDPISPSRVPHVRTNAIGSVCITSSSLDMSCGMCPSSKLESSSLCRQSTCTLQDDSSLFGPCNFHGNGTKGTLASALVAATQATKFPPPSPLLVDGARTWWKANEYVPESMRMQPPLTPSIYGPAECLEGGINQIWVGPDEDIHCRQLTARLLEKSSDDVFCAAAMEGPGFLRVIFQTQPSIPYAIVRGASNYNMFPPMGTAISWGQNASYTSPERHDAFVKEGYRYAILTTNVAILGLLEQLS